MKNLFFSFFFMSQVFGQSSQQIFVYDGIKSEMNFRLEGPAKHSRYNYMISEIKLTFLDSSRIWGRDIRFQLAQDSGLLHIMTHENSGHLVLGKLIKQKQTYKRGVKYLQLALEVQFSEKSLNINNLLSQSLKDFSVEDDFLAFSCGEVGNKEYLNIQLEVKKDPGAFKKYITLLQRELKIDEFEVIEFGNKRSLVTIDLGQLLEGIDRDKTHKIKPTLSLTFQGKVVLNKELRGKLGGQVSGLFKTKIQ